MKKSNIIAVIVVVAIVIVAVAFAVNGHNDDSSSAGEQTTQAVVTQQEDKIPVPDEAAAFFKDYTDLQNEASRKVETGAVSMEKYTDLLQKGIEIAQMKEQFEQSGANDELNKQIAEVKPWIYQFAKEMNSDLAEKFK